MLLWIGLMPVCTMAANVKKDLSEAIADKSVIMEAVNFEGRYVGKTTRLSVTNTTKEVLQLKINPGVILKPNEDGYQPMVLLGEEMLVVGPGTSGQVEVQTFCGNSDASCPKTDLHYSFSHVGSDTLIKVLGFISKNRIRTYLGQHAVWVITNHKSLGTVYSAEEADLSKRFVDFLSSVTGLPKPDYYQLMTVHETPSQPVYVPKALKIVAEFQLYIREPKTLTFGVFNEKGVMIQKVFENQEFPAMGHRFELEFESSDEPAGKYFLRLKEGDKVLQEKMVIVE